MREKFVTLISMFVLFYLVSGMLPGAKQALLIGIGDYKISNLPSLKGPNNDLALMKKVLQDRFSFPGKNITLLMDKQSTHTNIKKAFEALEKRIKGGDFVYIHYSGHGSLVRDENGDEYPRNFDQTWVTYGSRSSLLKGNDRYDISDDLLYQWLKPIFEKTNQVIFVSDSCHSASISRGEIPGTRSVAMDKRKYPFGKKVYRKPDFQKGIRIGATEDDESAYEYRLKNGNTYGAFTWFWAKALQKAQPGNTWLDIFKQTKVKVTRRIGSQIPQFQGDIHQPIFGGKFKPISPRIPIGQVLEKGNKIRIEQGLLSGITVDSLYCLFDTQNNRNNSIPIAKITMVQPFYSEADVIRGPFKVGDLIIEEEHAYHFQPVPIFINADDPRGEDKQIIDDLHNLFTNEDSKPRGFQLSDNQPESKILLYVLRPKKEKGEFLKENPMDTLPQSFPGHSPEVWILNNCEKNLLFSDIHIPFTNLSRGKEQLLENLDKIARLVEINNLSSGTAIDIELATTVWKPVKKCPQSQNDCIYLKDISQYFKRGGIYGLKDMENHSRFSRDTLLTFSLKNNTSRDYYTYIIDIMMDGSVKPIYPSVKDFEQDALLPVGKIRDLKNKVFFLLDTPGRETIKLIITEKPIDISLLQQNEYQYKGGEDKNMNPLECLLTSVTFGKRGKTLRIKNTQWGIKQYEIIVTSRNFNGVVNSKNSELDFVDQFNFDELDKELISKVSQGNDGDPFKFEIGEGTHWREIIMKQMKEFYEHSPPSNRVFAHMGIWELANIMMLKAREFNEKRGIWGADDRLDYFEIKDRKVKQNADSVAAIVMQEDINDYHQEFSQIRVKNYGKSFNLYNTEPFRHQPIAVGRLCTGFLVKEDVVATAAHCADERNVTDLCFIFNYKMSDFFSLDNRLAKEEIYRGLKIIKRVYNPNDGLDWALIQLDRRVIGQPVAKLSRKKIFLQEPIYIIGYPVGLPLKYAPGARVLGLTKNCFSANLDVYSGNSGSPVFDRETHEVIGMVIHGYSRDFRWNGKGWISMIYTDLDNTSPKPQCIRTSEFMSYCNKNE